VSFADDVTKALSELRERPFAMRLGESTRQVLAEHIESLQAEVAELRKRLAERGETP